MSGTPGPTSLQMGAQFHLLSTARVEREPRTVRSMQEEPDFGGTVAGNYFTTASRTGMSSS